MNKEIKQKIEEYVKEGFEDIESLDSSEDGYYSARGSIIKEINTLVELLQKDDINENTSIFNKEKLKNEITKIEKEYDINLKKLECEVNKNKDTLNLEKEKIKNGYEIDNKKIENDIAKLDNELRKINYDNEINDRKIQCDIDRIKNDITKVSQEYEINLKKIQTETNKNNDTLRLETRKIDVTEIKNNSDTDLRKKELNISAKKDVELRSDRIIKILIDGATIIVPVIFYNVWMKKGFEFEETGTFTSNTFKNLISKFKPNK
jgi:hypothetical protein